MIKSCYFSLCRVHVSEVAKQTHLKFETFCENGGRDNAKKLMQKCLQFMVNL